MVWDFLVRVYAFVMAMNVRDKPSALAPSPWPTIPSEDAVGETARQFLRFDSGESKTIRISEEPTAQVIALNWRGGEVSAAGARLHNPLVCLPSVGYKLEGVLLRCT